MNPTSTIAPTVTDAMIEAARQVADGVDDTAFGRIYLAMHNARTPSPTSEDVERVARAIADCEWDQACTALGTPSMPRGGNWTAKLPQARTAITAMQPPQPKGE